MTAGLYVHVPFCAALCPYCDFAVVVGREDLHRRYCDALLTEADAAGWQGPFDTMFVGGGTPTAIAATMLAETLAKLRAGLAVVPDAEATVEANPESVDEASLGLLRAAGLNRISLGAQSFEQRALAALGRTHAPEDTVRAVAAARAAGFDNLSLDLIYGAPGESLDDWRRSLRAAIDLGVEHLSCYALTIEERTAFGSAVARGAMAEPEQDALADRYELAIAMLAGAGYRHYELSNWAKPGYESRHNLGYWTQADCLGLGVGAHSHRDGRRWWNTRSIRRYLADPGGAREGEERLDDPARGDEWLALRLRLVEGLDLREAAARTGRPLAERARGLADVGLVALDGGRLALTARGMLLENEVALALLS